MTPSEMLAVRWRVQRFDADSYVMTYGGSDIVAGCESFELATHVVARHNEWLDMKKPVPDPWQEPGFKKPW